MTTIHSTIVSTLTLALLLLTGFPLATNAQSQLDLSGATDATYDIETQTSTDCDDTDERCEPGTTRSTSDGNELDGATPAAVDANYNNSRSNRANISVSGETNVCDGVTCPDGSCAATADECSGTPATGAEVREETNLRPDRMEGATVDPDRLDEDSDGDGLDDGTQRSIREGGRTIDAGTVPERTSAPSDADADGRPDFRDEDSDDDGLDDGTERAQDYNSSRSNKPTRAVFSDTDTDGDGVPEATLRAGGFIKLGSIEGEASSRVDTGEVVCWGSAEEDDGTVYRWGRGLCVAAAATADAEGVAADRIAALQVRGDEVRGWSEAERDAWQEYVQTRATTSPEERLAARAIEHIQSNERIRKITSDDEGLNVRYRSQLRLFGLIPLERDVDARVNAAGEVTINYPWYRVLSRTPDTTTIQEIMNSLTSIEGGGGGGRISL